jgi:hypothetical protein
MIIIAQYHGKSMLSKMIRWQQRSEISHTAVMLASGLTEAVISSGMSDWLAQCTLYEAWGSVMPPRGSIYKRRGIAEGHTPNTKIDLYTVTCDGFKAHDFLEEQVGKKYDFRALISFLTRRDRQREDAWICSELGFMAALQGGTRLLERIEAYAVSPGLLNLSPVMKPLGATWTAVSPIFMRSAVCPN